MITSVDIVRQQEDIAAIGRGEPTAMLYDSQGITVRILADTLWALGYSVPQQCGVGTYYAPEQLKGLCAGVDDRGQWVHGYRLTTFECEYPLMIHNEVLTHRDKSRCSASSRAVPTELQVERVREHPFIPRGMTARKSGMQGGVLDGATIERARNVWVGAASSAAIFSERLLECGVHKQHATRLLAPFMNIRTVISGTDWANFYALRCSRLAQPEFHVLASLMYTAHRRSMPRLVRDVDLHTHRAWHLPYVSLSERVALIADGFNPIEMSIARCARVSYDTKDTKPPPKDAGLYSDLVGDNHSSPHEHAAHPATREQLRHANYYGWRAHRVDIERKYEPGQVFPDDADIVLANIE